MKSGDAVWGGLLVAGAVFETWALRTARQEATLSASTRRWFRVHTKAGAVCFAVVWTGTGVWYLNHILT